MIDPKIFKEIKTEKLFLRKLFEEDKNEIFAIRSNLEIAKYLNRPLCNSVHEALSFIKRINTGIENGECLYWGICVKPNEKIIGTICLWNISDDGLNAEIGFELLPEHQGKGLMSEATELVLHFAFDNAKFNMIIGETTFDNFKSIKIMKKLGFNLNTEIADETNPNMIYYVLENPNKAT